MEPAPGAADDGLTGPWRRSSHSGAQGNCVELAAAGRDVAVRNSRHPDGPVLRLTRTDLAAFLAAVRTGALDD